MSRRVLAFLILTVFLGASATTSASAARKPVKKPVCTVKASAKKRSVRTKAKARAAVVKRCPKAKTKPKPTTTTPAPAPTPSTSTTPSTPTTTIPPSTPTLPPSAPPAKPSTPTTPAPTTTIPPSTPTLPPSTPPAKPVPGKGLLVGTHVYAQWTAAWTDPSKTLQQALDIGATGSREGIRWDAIEPSQGNFEWTRYDRLFAASAKMGMTILPEFQAPPAWVTRDAGYVDRDEFATFVAAVVKRYAPGGSFWAAHPELPAAGAPQMWEMWNEPYEDAFSAGQPDPAAFARLFVAAADAGRRANPNAKFLLAATYKNYGGRSWVDGMYAAVPDLNDHFDAVAVHPYGFDVQDPDGWYRRTMEGIRAEFVAHGASDKPFWATEVGWATCDARRDDRCTTEANQAKLFTEAVGLMATRYSSYVRAVFLYSQHDGENFAAGDSNDNYGLFHYDGTPKPIVAAIKAFTAVLNR